MVNLRGVLKRLLVLIAGTGYIHTVGGLTFREWIPYEGNEHLLGTIVTPKE